jgi:site-specific recombinase XerD
MLTNQDFAQSEPKSPVKRSLVLVTNANLPTREASQTSNPNPATKLLQETITKIDGAYAPSTIRAYRVDFQDLIKFCSGRNAQALPAQPKLVVEYISKLTNSGRSSASIRRAIAGIATIHKLNRLTDPTKDPDVALEMRRMHRKLGRASHQAQAVTKAILDKLLDATEDDVRGVRDRALLLVAYDTMCRRSELTALQTEDVESTQIDGVERMTVLIRRSKTDQESFGRRLHVGEKAKKALEEWMGRLDIKHGQLFRGVNRAQKITSTLGSSQINRIYKRIAKNSGLNQNLTHGISGHSMRVGHAQDLVNSGASMPIIMQRGRWSKTDTVMRYVEHILHDQK